jgi:hypothetical protein
VLVEASCENMTGTPVFSVPTPPRQPVTLGQGSTNTLRLGGKFLLTFAPR